MPSFENIAVIGAGLMGHGIALLFAGHGHHVTILDTSDDLLAKAIKNIRSELALMVQRGIGQQEDIEQIINRITATLDLEEAASTAQFIVEAAPEELGLKQTIFQSLDAICPSDTILATNTSVISITKIAQNARHQERIVGTHFWNPPYLIPLVEVVKGENTSPEVVDLTFDLLKSMGKHPVRVKKDVPGFIGNRLQHALWREAISIVEHDIADPASVDEVIKKGFGIRLPVLGPLENADMVGLDLTFQIHNYVLRHIESSSEPSPLLKRKIDADELGFKTGKGFQEWSSQRAQEARTNLMEHLLEQVKEDGSAQWS